MSFGLREVLGNAHHVREIEGDTPLVSAALHRLLIAIVHRNVEVDSVEAWAALWEVGRLDMDAFDDYFRQLGAAVSISSIRVNVPSTRCPASTGTVSTSSARLLFHQANNATLFRHIREDRPPALAPAEAARLLIGLMAFDFGGTKTRGKRTGRAPEQGRGGACQGSESI